MCMYIYIHTHTLSLPKRTSSSSFFLLSSFFPSCAWTGLGFFDMGKLSFGRVLDRFCFSTGGGINSCLCFNDCTNRRDTEDIETKPLIITHKEEGDGQLMRLKDVISGPPTLALQLKPKIVVLKVSMHCNGCARKVEKHISKMEGVTSYQVDLETKMVVITGDIVPFEVLESVSKVKTAELWNSSIFSPTHKLPFF